MNEGWGIGLGSLPVWLQEMMAAPSLMSQMQGRYDTQKRRQAQGMPAAGPPQAGTPEAEEALNLAGAFDFTGPIGLGATIKAYHGSPHTFDRFDMSKIGTGEGAQSYGHGLYFAESPEVAKSYRTVPAAVGEETAEQMAARLFDDAKGDKARALEEVNTRLSRAEERAAGGRIEPGEIEPFRERMQQVRQLIEAGDPRPGGMYTVNLDVNHDDLLDWDAPLSQQPEKVRKALEGFTEPVAMADGGPVRDALMELPALARIKFQNGLKQGKTVDEVLAATPGGTPEFQEAMQAAAAKLRNAQLSVAQQKTTAFRPDMTGGTLIGQIREQYGSPVAAAEVLRAAGIPGLRYFDQGSRATTGGEILGVTKGDKGWTAKIRVQNRGGVGFTTPTTTVTTSKPYATEAEARSWADEKTSEGTRNFVLFDDSLAQIVERK